MTKYEELEQRGKELVALRDGCKDESKRAMLNKEITALRQAQIKALADECVEAFNIAIPEMVKQAIQSSDVVKQIEELQRGE
ncbi:TPA: hypothetical protein ACGRVX_004521 [Escherichia coli]